LFFICWYQDISVPGHLGTEHMRHLGTEKQYTIDLRWLHTVYIGESGFIKHVGPNIWCWDLIKYIIIYKHYRNIDKSMLMYDKKVNMTTSYCSLFVGIRTSRYLDISVLNIWDISVLNNKNNVIEFKINLIFFFWQTVYHRPPMITYCLYWWKWIH
jgi:hypothetical protein